MVKVLPFSFEQCFGPLTMLLVEGSSETGFFGIDLTTLLGVSNFKNTLSIRVTFFSENVPN